MTLFLRLIILLLACIGSLSGSASQLRFIPLGDENMSNWKTVHHIYQDSQNYVWLSTDYGLNRLSGNLGKVFMSSYSDSLSLRNNYVLNVLEDSRGQYWVMSSDGVSCYNKSNESFHPFSFSNRSFSFVSMLEDHGRDKLWLLTSTGLVSIDINNSNQYTILDIPEIERIDPMCFLLSQDKLWIGGRNGTVALYDLKTGYVETLCVEALENKRITSMCEDNFGNIWLAALDGGLYSLNTQTYLFSGILSRGTEIAEKLALTLMKDSKGQIWIGTDGRGLWLLDEKARVMRPFDIGYTGFDHRAGKVSYLFEDRQGNIWVSFVEKGIAIIPRTLSGFRSIENDYFSAKRNISDHSILSVCMDSDERLWVGTNGGGLYIMTMEDGYYNVESHVLPHENVITALYQDSRGLMYIGTYLHGLYIYDPRKKDYQRIVVEDSSFLRHNHVSDIIEDRKGNIWVATQGGGLCCVPDLEGKYRFYHKRASDPKHALSSDYVTELCLDEDRLWVGSSYGINCIDLHTGNTIQRASYTRFGNNQIISLCKGQGHSLWVGTRDGLFLFDYDQDQVFRFSDRNGLPDNFIMSLERSESGIWVSTSEGLARYDELERKFVCYDEFDGVKNPQFKERASAVGKNGLLYFGGNRGITFFDPENINTNVSVPGLTFSGFYLFGEKVLIGDILKGKVLLDKILDDMETIVLPYDQNSVAVDYDAFLFAAPSLVSYEYKLDGFDEQWNLTIGNTQRAVYTNLRPGNYQLRVRAFVGERENAVERSLNIYVTPPFWLSVWAKIFYLLVFVFLLIVVYRIIKIRMNERKLMAEQKNREAISQARLQWFTDISHEIRTPLTLVLSPLQRLMTKTVDEETAASYRLMYRNGTRILRLVNQLLDARKLEKGQMKLKVEEVDPLSLVNSIMDSFRPVAAKKRLSMNLYAGKLPEKVFLDVDLMDKVLYNVISNAVKYTPQGGAVQIYVNMDEQQYLRFEVEDSGIGIAPENMERIFERFYRVEGQQGVGNNGSGIGLHLTKSLLTLHHGTIQVVSEMGKGSKFIFKIPSKGSAYTKEEMRDVPYSEENTQREEQVYHCLDEVTVEEQARNKRKKKVKVLVVEDDRDIRAFLSRELGEFYLVLEAEDGKAGYELTLKELPDLIISDVMMPVMDGMTMVRKLRGNSNTAGIPIVLLTAKTGLDDLVEGLDQGVDAYLPKPFNIEHLVAQINNLLRRQTRQKVQSSGETTREVDSSFDIKNADEKMIARLNTIIKEHISDSSLTIEGLSAEFGISRVHLHRKLKELYNQTPSVYLRNIRLEHAAYLLRTKKISIAEVAFAVGFNSQQYFTNCFKDLYGLSPSAYAAEHENGMKKEEN